MFALDEPEKYGELYLNYEHSVEFPPLKSDEFFVLGDNSPASLDSRLWDDTHAVPRHAMLGKAFFIYWPHGVPFLNGGEGFPITYHRGGTGDDRYPKMRLPFYPNIPRMERIR
jgi:signal peptidase I